MSDQDEEDDVCVECGDDGWVMGLADCTTGGRDCGCNGPRVRRPCPECQPEAVSP